MFDAITYDVLSQALRVLFLLAAPVVVVVAIAGVLISALQSATTIQDTSSSYAVRLIALVLVVVIMYRPFVYSLTTLAELAWRGQ